MSSRRAASSGPAPPMRWPATANCSTDILASDPAEFPMRLPVLALVLVGAAAPAFGQGQVNVYNWSDYIAEAELKNFQKDTGIKVNYTTYDSNEILDAKLKTGRSGYDVVVPTASPFFVRQLAAKLYQPLDRARLKHWGDLDPTIMTSLAK